MKMTLYIIRFSYSYIDEIY